MKKKILVTGGAGFIGSNFILHMLSTHKGIKIINYDKLTYAANLSNLKSVSNDPRYSFVRGDIVDEQSLDKVVKKVDCIINFAAMTHVDRAYAFGREFAMANVVGVQTILEAVKRNDNIQKVIHISTDEVYGSLDLDSKEKFTEDTPFAPNAIYAATKAGGDLLCRAYHKTYNLPVIVTHCSNNYGPMQYPEKLIPFFTIRALANKPLPLYGDGKNIRDWIYVLDHCKAVEVLLEQGKVGKVYNIGADNERSNLEITKFILEILDKPESLITFVKDRPAHDRRYAVDASKIRKELGWKPEYGRHNFKEGLSKTINWYKENRKWVEDIKKKGAVFNPQIKYVQRLDMEDIKKLD